MPDIVPEGLMVISAEPVERTGQLSEQKKANLIRLSDVQPLPDVTINPTRLATIIRQSAIEILPREWQVLPDGRATHSVFAAEVLKRMD